MHKLCMIPGPVEFDALVLSEMGSLATSHVDPQFIGTFGGVLELMRTVFVAPTAQPLVVAGSGTLTWDVTASNLVEPGEHVLVINTGIFGDWFADCLQVYGASVSQVTAAFGDVPLLADIERALLAHSFKLVTITHVDTSSGVLVDVQKIAALIHRVSPHSLIALDAVCSAAAEEIRMDQWGLDVVMTASQKAIGVPPGLALMMFSQRAIRTFEARVAPETSYFASLSKWLPIMRKYEARQPSYFATPPVQLIKALHVSLTQIVNQGMEVRFAKHIEASQKIKSAISRMGMQLVPATSTIAANTLTAVYYPSGISPSEFLKSMTNSGVVIAGGLHPLHNTKYFRIGHMNISACEQSNGHLDKVIQAIETSLLVAKL